MMPAVAGIILVGGASSRLGQDKAMLDVAGVPAVRRIADALRPLVGDLVLVGGRDRLMVAGGRWIPDAAPGLGPLGGVVSGLAGVDPPWSIVLACDTPLVSGDVLRVLVDACLDCRGEAPADGPSSLAPIDAVVPRLSQGVEPLVALYARTALEPLRQALEAGERALHRALGRLRVRYVDEAAFRAVDPRLDAFLNVNTPADLARMRARLDAAGPSGSPRS